VTAQVNGGNWLFHLNNGIKRGKVLRVLLADISGRVNPWTYVKKKMGAVENLLDKRLSFSVKTCRRVNFYMLYIPQFKSPPSRDN
jgi:hypothetical protein